MPVNILVNMNRMCKRLLLAILALGLASSASQAQRFVYLQTADQTPFYIQLSGKTYSSTAAGYLLLGKLSDSVYPIRLGVLGSTDVQEYGLRVAGKDAGYYIKKSGEQQAWTLTNMLTGETQYSLEYTSALAAEKARQDMQAEAQRRADSTLQAQAMSRRADSIAAATAAADKAAVPTASTTGQAATPMPVFMPAPVSAGSDSLRQTAVPAAPAAPAADAAQQRADSLARVIAEKEKELKALQAALAAAAKPAAEAKSVPTPAATVVPVPAPRPVAADSGATSKARTPAPAGQPALLDMEFAMPVKDSVAPVAKLADSAMAATQPSQPAARPLVDSARIMPAPAAAVPAASAPASSQPTRVRDVFANAGPEASRIAATDSVPQPAGTMPAAAASASDSLQRPTADTAAKMAPAATADTALPAAKATDKARRNPCTSLLDRDQLAQLQQQAARLIDKDEIVALYKNAFVSNCITTSNLRRIAGSLASDVARYKLLEAAYPHTLDYYAFGELSTLLTDAYYLNKFKSLLSQ